MYEVEIKFRVTDPAALERRLTALGCHCTSVVEQVDRYLAHPCRDFAATDEALRLRSVGDALAVTWKGPRIGGGTKTREELELPIAASGGPGAAGLAEWTALLGRLGFRTVRDVAKRRRRGSVRWRGAEVEVALDHVAGLGDFIELELVASLADVAAAEALVTTLAHELGCAEPERRSYLEMLLGHAPSATDGSGSTPATAQ